jgi:hypothetical protein
MVYLSNKAGITYEITNFQTKVYLIQCFNFFTAVYFEQEKLKECIETSLEAIKIGSENKATSNLIAK